MKIKSLKIEFLQHINCFYKRNKTLKNLKGRLNKYKELLFKLNI